MRREQQSYICSLGSVSFSLGREFTETFLVWLIVVHECCSFESLLVQGETCSVL